MDTMVYLVGAGPGDVELITLKGLSCIQKADVIVYDRLVNIKLLSYAKDTAELIYVGKKENQHTLPQEEINSLLIEKAKEKKNVVRLKGGDPFVFGRGGEEALALKEENIAFEIVPGISSSIAAPAYAGIPVTHRGMSTSFHVITGHEDPTKPQEQVDYETIAKLSGTLVFLMGLNNLHKICKELIFYGKPLNTPMAIISKGTSKKQKTVIGSLEDIESKAKEMVSPSLILVGDVVHLKEELNWFEKKPLFGKNILVTRSRHQSSDLVQKIEEQGGNAIEFPTIEIQEIKDKQKIIEMFDNINQYHWIVFTSVNAVEIFFQKLLMEKKDIRCLGKAKLCAIGKATKEALEKRYLHVEITPKEYVSEALVKELELRISKGEKVLIPRAEVAREVLPHTLRSLGIEVDVVSLYETALPYLEENKLEQILESLDIITFTSSSTVNNFTKILGKDKIEKLKNIFIACIGPITAQTAKDLGINVNKVAKEYTVDGLMKALMEE